MHTILLTGFGPFKEHKVNPSQVIAESLCGEKIAGATITSLVLPVEFGLDTEIVIPAVRKLSPVFVLSLGLNAGTSGLDLEMFAINHRHNSTDTGLIPIIDDGPAAYFSTLNVAEIVRAASGRATVPVRSHGYAGSYLCNHIFYQTLHFAINEHIDTRAGFLHVPYATEHLGPNSAETTPSYPLESMIESTRIIVEEAIKLHLP